MAVATRTSIFADDAPDLYTTYLCELELVGKLMGGTPRDPKIIQGWLRSKAGVTDEYELVQMIRRTLLEQGVEVPADASYEDMVAASESVAAEQHMNGFKQNDYGIYIESRQIKAMLKESTNVLYANHKWIVTTGSKGKAPRSIVAERVFVEPDVVLLDRAEPDGVDLVIGHVFGADRPRSTLTYHEYALQPTLRFEVRVVEDCITSAQWARIWRHAEQNGLGALRSQGYGKFVVTRWEKAE